MIEKVNSIPFRFRIFLSVIMTLIIYFSLPFSRMIINPIRDLGMLALTINLAYFSAGSIIAYVMFFELGLKRLNDYFFLLLLGLLLATLFYFIDVPEERLHIIQYASLTAVIWFTLLPKLEGTKLYQVSFCLGSLAGILDEVIQYFLPNRYFDWRDIAFNILGASVAVFVVFTIEKIADQSQRE